MNKKLFSFVAQFLFGGLILLVVLSRYGYENYINSFNSIDLYYLGCALVFNALAFWLVTVRFKYVLDENNIQISMFSLWWTELWGGLVGMFQKGLGSLVVINSIHAQTSVPRTEIMNRYLLVYAVDLMFRGFGLGAGAVFVSSMFPEIRAYGLWVGVVIVTLSVGYLVSVMGPKPIRLLKDKAIGFVPFGLVRKIFDDKTMSGGLESVFWVSLLSLFVWAITAAKWLFISRAMGYPVGFLFCFVVINLTNLFRLVPFIPTSLGIYDLAVAFGFSLGGFSPEAGLTFAMLDRFNDILLYSMVVLKPEYLGLSSGVLKEEIKI